MANLSQHRVKAQGNREFLREIDPLLRGDWAVVVAFYTAVHLVEQLRALAGCHSKSHQHRLDYIQADHRAIHGDFQRLYFASRLARYDSNSQFYQQFANADIQRVVIDGWLAAVETYVDALGALTP